MKSSLVVGLVVLGTLVGIVTVIATLQIYKSLLPFYGTAITAILFTAAWWISTKTEEEE